MQNSGFNSAIASAAAAPALQQYLFVGDSVTKVGVQFGRWNTGLCAVDAVPTDAVLTKVHHQLLDSLTHTRFVDFDMHLENPGLDHFNDKLFTLA